jgi:hypothetical protein
MPNTLYEPAASYTTLHRSLVTHAASGRRQSSYYRWTIAGPTVLLRLFSSDGLRNAEAPWPAHSRRGAFSLRGAFCCQARGVESSHGVPRIRTHGTYAFGCTFAQSQLQIVAAGRLRLLGSA